MDSRNQLRFESHLETVAPTLPPHSSIPSFILHNSSISLFITFPPSLLLRSKPSPAPLSPHRSRKRKRGSISMDTSVLSSSSSSSSSSCGSIGHSDLEAGFSGSAPLPLYPSYSSRIRASYRSMVGSHSPRSLPPARFFCESFPDDDAHYFLDSCFLCKKQLRGNCDIFMYRGDTPFCSEECRQEQIEIDEAKEKNWKVSLKVSSRKEKQQPSNRSTSPSKSQKIHVRAGTVVAG